MISFLFTLLTGICFSWSYAGHRIVAQIANSLIDRRCVANWLRSNETLVDISTHPDEYIVIDRNQAAWSRPLHYSESPMDRKIYIFDSVTCPDTRCVVSALLNYTNRFVTTKPVYSAAVAPSALSFLVHFMGDIHQPLHCAFIEDRGGNSVLASFFGSLTNLHSVWDGAMIFRYNPKWSYLSDYLLDYLKNNVSQADITRWKNFGDFETIASEGFQITLNTSYKFSTIVIRNKTYADLGQNYYDINFPIVKQRLLMGGVRLASVISSLCSRKRS